MNAYLAALICVVGISIGQTLFKACANSLQAADGQITLHSLLYMGAAMALYGITSIAWVLVLKQIELGKVYPLMALAFLLVPILSYFIFGEKFSPHYFIGVALIMAGVFVTTRTA